MRTKVTMILVCFVTVLLTCNGECSTGSVICFNDNDCLACDWNIGLCCRHAALGYEIENDAPGPVGPPKSSKSLGTGGSPEQRGPQRQPGIKREWPRIPELPGPQGLLFVNCELPGVDELPEQPETRGRPGQRKIKRRLPGPHERPGQQGSGSKKHGLPGKQKLLEKRPGIKHGSTVLGPAGPR